MAKNTKLSVSVNGRDVSGRFQKNLFPTLTRLEKLLGKTALYKKIQVFFDKEALIAAGFVVKTTLSGQLLNRRTGSLARSMTGRGVQFRGLPAMKVGVFRGPALQYAGIQEHGGTIKPKKAKALAIPQEAVLTPAGVDRFGGPRGYPGELRFIPFRSSGVAIGGLFDADSLDDQESTELDLGDGILAYMLVREVKIPATHFLSRGFRAYLPTLGQNFAKFLALLLLGEERRANR